MGETPFRIPWANISDEDLLQFADNVLKTDPGQQRLASGAYFMLLDKMDAATGHFTAALAAGVQEAQTYLDVLADGALAKRMTESVPLFDGKSADKWIKPPGSAWAVDIDNESLVIGENKTSLFVESKNFNEYVYSLKAKKLSGANGFAVSFKAFGRCLTWVLGDNANQESLVLGVPSTKTNEAIETHRWYRVRLVVTKDSASGYLDGVRKWTVDRLATTTAEDAAGMGIGAYATKVCFRNMAISMLKAQ
jgi:hypothetical protein